MKKCKAIYNKVLCVVCFVAISFSTAYGQNTDSPQLEKENYTENNSSATSSLLPNPSTVNNKPVNSPASSNFPFVGIIAGDSVYVRSGPATPYYPVGKLSKGQEVIVTQIRTGKRNWARIEPVPGCFAYISCNYVDILEPISNTEFSDGVTGNSNDSDSSDAGANEAEDSQENGSDNVDLVGKELLTGIVTGNNIRVRAGSIDISPNNANRVLMLASKGQQVQIIGKRDNYYKIVPPRGSYFWVAADFIERSNNSTVANVNSLRDKTREQLIAVNSDEELKTQYVQLKDVLNKYEVVQKMPLIDRDYAGLRVDVEDLAKQTDSPAVKATAEMLLKNILKGETAQKQLSAAISQDKKIEEAMLKIDEAVNKALSENLPAGDAPDIVVAKGKLAESAVFTTGVTKRYLLLDSSGMISYYVSGDGLEQYIGKTISISGTSSFDPSTQTRFIEANRVVIID